MNLNLDAIVYEIAGQAYEICWENQTDRTTR